MKISTRKGLLLILGGSLIALSFILFGLLQIGKDSGSRPPPPSRQAVRCLLIYVLEYAEKNGNLLPDLVSPEALRQVKHYPQEISPESVIYLVPKERDVTRIPSDMPLAIYPYAEGAYVGFIGGNISFYRGGNRKHE